MSWVFYLGLAVFLAIVFTIFLLVAHSVILGIRDNYLRYYQKAELQWTGPVTRPARRAARFWLYFILSLAASLLIVEFVIKP